ncbi:MAG: M13 family metallopeptidase [Bacteroidia bacterium]
MHKHFITLTTVIALFTILALKTKNKPGIQIQNMDTSILPGEDFFKFANGGWIKNSPIPASESRWGSFNEVTERNNLILKQILEQSAKNTKAPVGSTIQKVGTVYRLYMDTVARNNMGIKPVEPILKHVESIENNEQLINTLAYLHKIGIRPMFNMGVGQDLKNSTSYIVYASQGGLSLPDRDYYLKDDEKSKKIREAFINYIDELESLYNLKIGLNQTVMRIETELAKSSMTRTERRNQEKQYNKRSFNDFVKTYPNLLFNTYCKEIGIAKFDSLIVSQPDFYGRLNSMLNEFSINEWKQYLTWHVINNAASKLTTATEQASFKFYATTLTGTKEQKELWKRGIGAVNGTVGELLGQLFVKRAFTESSKAQVNSMVDDIMAAFKIRIENLEWMSRETKQKALEKLASFNRKFGYPDKWRDYSALEIKNDSYIENEYRSNVFNFNDNINRLGKPIDRTRWGMTPQTVNAYYSATLNEIVFPAAIMQPPFFDPKADVATNYGSIGAVIGHELTHGFDDQGSKYGPDGNLKSWWTEEDRKKFEERTKVLVNQFNSFEVLPELFINGELTLGENIADLGGLLIAYDALKIYLQKNPKANRKIDGYTPEQRFFIGFAQVWKNQSRPEYIRNQILTDPHSPAEYRVKGTLKNMQAFFDAFNITEKDKMYRKPEDRAVIW